MMHSNEMMKETAAHIAQMAAERSQGVEGKQARLHAVLNMFRRMNDRAEQLEALDFLTRRLRDTFEK